MLRKIIVCVVGLGWMVTLAPVRAQDCTEFSTAREYYGRGEIAFEQQLYEDVILDMTCAIHLDPTVADYYNERGRAYYWLEQDAEARADFTKTIELDPEAGYAYNNLANLYATIGDYEQAVEYYTLSLELDGNDVITLSNRASVYTQEGSYDLALADLQATFSLNSRYNYAFLNLATLYAIQNNVEQAADNYYQWVLEIETESATPAYIPNRTYETRLEEGTVERITVVLNAGDVVDVSASATDDSQRVDPLIVILDPQENAVIADDDSGVNIDAVISNFTADSAGSYTLVLAQAGGFYEQNADGLVNITIQVSGSDGELVADAVVTPSVSTDLVETPVETDVAVSFSTFRLFAGVQAEVYTTAGDRLNLRSGPGLRFDILSKLDKGAFVTLIEGPRKQDGLAWWRIRAVDGSEGWAVERVDTEQTLQMALIVGEQALVTTGEDALNVRSAAGRSNDLAFQLIEGEQVTLVEVAPELVDGFQWWLIRTSDGREGWTIDRLEGERMLIPAKERDAQ